jgi:protein gp37
MGTDSAIEWTDSTWNPWRGCTKVDPTCAKCYMLTEQRRYGRDPSVVVRCTPSTFNAPLSAKWARKRAECIADHGRHLVFTCSWSDWFHADADPWRDDAWDVIRRTPDSVFQILTSRPERIREHLPADWGDGWPNVWLGVTIGTRKFVDRADMLRAVPAAVRFISAEPLLGPLVPPICDWYVRDLGYVTGPGRYTGRHFDGSRAATPVRAMPELFGPALDLTDIDWLIVGGESGGRAGRRLTDEHNQPRTEREQWVRDLRDACVSACSCSGLDVGPDHEHRPAFLFKQWGGGTSKSGGRLLDGRTWDEMPPLAPLVVT